MSLTAATGIASPPYSGSGDLTLTNILNLTEGNLVVGKKIIGVQSCGFTTGAAALNTGAAFFIAPKAITIQSITIRWGTAGASSNTINIVKASSGTAIASGTTILTANIDGTTTADTNVSPTLTANTLTAGQALGFIIATGTGPANICCTVTYSLT